MSPSPCHRLAVVVTRCEDEVMAAIGAMAALSDRLHRAGQRLRVLQGMGMGGRGGVGTRRGGRDGGGRGEGGGEVGVGEETRGKGGGCRDRGDAGGNGGGDVGTGGGKWGRGGGYGHGEGDTGTGRGRRGLMAPLALFPLPPPPGLVAPDRPRWQREAAGET